MAILKNTTINGATSFVKIAEGDGAARSATPATGELRFNTSRQELESYNNSQWSKVQTIRNNEVTDGRILDLDGSQKGYSGTGSTWPDTSASNQGAILNSSPTHSTNFDGFFNFNGSTQFASNTTFNIGADPVFSISMWIRRTADLSNGGYWGLGGDGASNRGICGYTSSGRVNKIAWDLWGQTTFDINSDYPLNQWIHVTWVKLATGFTTSTLKIYVNGVDCPLTNTNRNNSSTVNIVPGYAIGRISPTEALYFAPGDVANVHIFNRALSESEVSQHFLSQANRFYVSTVGCSSSTPAESAEQIRQCHANPPNGFYWIRQTGSTAFRHYCVFRNQAGGLIQGGPWTVAFRNNYAPGNFSTNGPAAMETFRQQCRTVGVETPGRGMENFRTVDEARGGWLAVKRAIWEGYTAFVQGRTADSGGTIALPVMNINGEGGSSDHRTVYDPQYGTHLSPNQDADACNANQLFCGWWGGTDFSSWATNNDGLPGPEDWGPGNASNVSFGGAGLTPQLLACVYR
jgi:hypothetical protein